MPDSLKLHESFLRHPKAITAFLFFWCLASQALAQKILPDLRNVTTLPGYNSQMSPHWEEISANQGLQCIVMPTEERVTFLASAKNGSQYMQTVFPNSSAVIAPLPTHYDSLVYLSNGNLLIVNPGTSNTSMAVIVTPEGQEIVEIILDIDRPECVASVRSGFLCYGITTSSDSTGSPVWKYFDNLGRYYPYLGQTLQEFIANETTCCIPMVNSTWNSWNGFSTETGSFLLVYIFYAPNTTIWEFNSIAYVVLTKPNSAVLANQPVLLFETFQPLPQYVRCGALQYGKGYFCNLGWEYITFTSTGIISSTPVASKIIGLETFPLHYGGILMVNASNTLYLADEKMNIIEMDNINDIYDNFTEMCISINNRAYVPKNCSTYPWSYFSFDVKKLIPNDLGYKNLNIMGSTPTIDQTVSMDASISLSIDFWPSVSQVRLNSGNIYIYQQNQPCPRQVISTNDFSLSNKTSIRSQQPLLSSTLNTPNATYYVEMDDGFAMTTELLPGVQGQNWVFQTEPRPFIYTAAVVVLIKFIDEGLQEYNRNWQFNDILLLELSQFIPISMSCLEIISEHAYSNQSTNTQFGPGLYLNVQISSDTNNINSALAQSSLATLITNLAQTNLQYGNITKFLDPNVPALMQEDIWDQFKIPIIAIGCSVIILLIVYILARRRYKEGRNLAIFTIVLSLLDFVLDTLFVVIHNGDISTLTIPILIFYIVPFTFNLLMAFKITLKEVSSNEEFSEWFHKNAQVVGIFTLLAVPDVETLRVLDSHIAGLNIFSTTFSSKAIRDMFIYSTLSFIIRDIPQLSIMILYKTISVQNYSIIPFLTLVSSGVICLIGILTRIYRATIFFREKFVKDVATQDLATADENEETTTDENEEATADENEEYTTSRQINLFSAGDTTSNAHENEDESGEFVMSSQTNLFTADGTSNTEVRRLINDNVATLGYSDRAT